jgi:hypothetical protein
VQVSKLDIKYSVHGMLCKFTLQSRPKFSKVYHFLYNAFSGRIQGVELGVMLDTILNNILYKFQKLIHYMYGVMLVESYGL